MTYTAGETSQGIKNRGFRNQVNEGENPINNLTSHNRGIEEVQERIS